MAINLNLGTGEYTEVEDSPAVEPNYQELRRYEYPSIPDQLDMQYWDSVNGTTTWKDKIAEVKANNPKPAE